MIDRKALWISGLIFLFMVAAALWRLSLFLDWQHMAVGRSGAHQTVSWPGLFTAPAALLLMMVIQFSTKWLQPKENLASWWRWSGKWIVSWSVFWALLQAFILAHSLGFVSVSPVNTARAFVALIGIVLTMVGNVLPKLPSERRSISLAFNPWQWNRFTGKLLVGMGLVFVLGGILMPPEWWKPVFSCLVFAALAALIGYGFKLGRERSAQ